MTLSIDLWLKVLTDPFSSCSAGHYYIWGQFYIATPFVKCVSMLQCWYPVFQFCIRSCHQKNILWLHTNSSIPSNPEPGSNETLDDGSKCTAVGMTFHKSSMLCQCKTDWKYFSLEHTKEKHILFFTAPGFVLMTNLTYQMQNPWRVILILRFSSPC